MVCFGRALPTLRYVLQLFKHLEEPGHASAAAKQAVQSASKAAKKELRRQKAAASKKEGRGFGGAVRG